MNLRDIAGGFPIRKQAWRYFISFLLLFHPLQGCGQTTGRTYSNHVDAREYGTYGLSRKVTDGLLSSSGATSATSSTANFTSADIGKRLWAFKSGLPGTQLTDANTTITGVTNSTTITFSPSSIAGWGAAEATFIIGKDDTTPLNNAWAAVQQNIPVVGGKTVLYIPCGNYVITDRLWNTIPNGDATVRGEDYRCVHLWVPKDADLSTTPLITLKGHTSEFTIDALGAGTSENNKVLVEFAGGVTISRNNRIQNWASSGSNSTMVVSNNDNGVYYNLRTLCTGPNNTCVDVNTLRATFFFPEFGQNANARAFHTDEQNVKIYGGFSGRMVIGSGVGLMNRLDIYGTNLFDATGSVLMDVTGATSEVGLWGVTFQNPEGQPQTANITSLQIASGALVRSAGTRFYSDDTNAMGHSCIDNEGTFIDMGGNRCATENDGGTVTGMGTVTNGGYLVP